MWAFATNVAGTTYGNRVQATTIQQFTPILATASSVAIEAEVGGSFGTGYVQSYIYYKNPYTNSLVNTSGRSTSGAIPFYNYFGISTYNTVATNARTFIYYTVLSYYEFATGQIYSADAYSGSNYDWNNRSIYLSGRWTNTANLLINSNSQSSMAARTNSFENIYVGSYIVFEMDFTPR